MTVQHAPFMPVVKATGQAGAPDPERDPLYDEPDVEPDPEGTEPAEDEEDTIPAGGEPGESHPVEEGGE